MKPTVWTSPFRCHIEACQVAVNGALTQLGPECSEQAIVYFSERLTLAEPSCTAIERHLLELVYFLKNYLCYLQRNEFEILIDNQVFRNFYSKLTINRREARWLKFLESFGISELTHVKGRVHVLGDALSRNTYLLRTRDLLIAKLSPDAFHLDLPKNFRQNYDTDEQLPPLIKALEKELLTNSVKPARVA